MARVRLNDAINRVQNNNNDKEALNVIIKAINNNVFERLFEDVENETIESEYDVYNYMEAHDLELEDTLADGLRRANALLENVLNEVYEVD